MHFVNAMATGAVATAGLPSKPPPPLLRNCFGASKASWSSTSSDLTPDGQELLYLLHHIVAKGRYELRCVPARLSRCAVSTMQHTARSHLGMDFVDVHPNPWLTPGHAGQPAQVALGVEASTPGAYIAGHLFSTSNNHIYHDFCIMRWALWSTHGVIDGSSLDPCTCMIV